MGWDHRIMVAMMGPWNYGCSDPLWGASNLSGFKNRPNWSVKWRNIGNNQLFSKIKWVSILEGPVLIGLPTKFTFILHVFPQLHKWKLWKGLFSFHSWLFIWWLHPMNHSKIQTLRKGGLWIYQQAVWQLVFCFMLALSVVVTSSSTGSSPFKLLVASNRVCCGLGNSGWEGFIHRWRERVKFSFIVWLM